MGYYTIEDLSGAAHGEWGYWNPTALNANRIVGMNLRPGSFGSVWRAVLWDGWAMEFDASPGGGLTGDTHSTALGINSSGDVVGNCSSMLIPGEAYGDLFQSFVRRANGTIIRLQEIVDASMSTLTSINDAGVAVGARGADYEPQELFTFDINDQSIVPYSTPPGFAGVYPVSINNSGDIVGVLIKPGWVVRRGFLLQGGQLTDLGQVERISRITNNGRILGNPIAGQPGGAASAIYDIAQPQSGWQPIGVLGGSGRSSFVNLNDSGVAVGGYRSFGSYGGICTWTAAYGIQDIKPWPADPKWQFEDVAGINASGQIVGTGTFNGNIAVFRATPVNVTPRPSLPALWIKILAGAISGGPGIGITGGGHLKPVPPRDPLLAQKLLEILGRDVAAGQTLSRQDEQLRIEQLDAIMQAVEQHRRR